MYDDEEYENDENNQNDGVDDGQANEGMQSSPAPASTRVKLGAAVKDPLAKVGKGVKKAASGFLKAAAQAWKVVPIQAKIFIILLVLLIAFFLLVINSETSGSASKSINSYIENTSNTIDEFAKNLYDKKKSLIMFKIADINGMYDQFKKDNETNKNTFYEIYKKKYGSTVVTDDRIVNEDDNLEIYKHVMLTEKYNFNNIKWKIWGHGVEDKDAELQEDKEIGLRYPKDPKNTELKDFVNMTLPYLQSWYIPNTMLTGDINKGVGEAAKPNFAYSIIKYCYSDMQVNRYDMNRCEKATTYEVDLSGNVTEGSTSKTETITYNYYIQKARTFDLYVNNKYTYIPYTSDQVDNNIDPDSISSTPRVAVYVTVKVKEDGKEVTKSVLDHYEYTTTRVWNDKLSQSNSEKRAYTYDDLKEYNENFYDDTKKIEEDKIDTDTNASNTYKAYEDEKILNLIDFMNANPNLYKEYINKDEEAPKYMGYTRSYLAYSYDELKRLFTQIIDTNQVLPFIYGSSLGIEKIYKDTQNNVLGRGLFVWPVPENLTKGMTLSDQITSHFGMRTLNGEFKGHSGIDISNGGNLTSNPIVAARSGTVVAVGTGFTGPNHSTEGTTASYGNYVKIDHHNGYFTLYGHMWSINVAIGDEVSTGQQIGIMGDTGNSYGVHLHFEVREGKGDYDDKIDPEQFFNEDCSPVGGSSGEVIDEGTPNISEEQKNELLSSLDAVGSPGWGSVNNAWTLQYYMDNDVELISRIICHENGLYDTNTSNSGAVEMVKCMTIAMKNRIDLYGSAYKTILMPNQFYSGEGRYDVFNKTPPQWVRDMVYNVYNGIEPIPDYLQGNEDIMYWAGPSDGASVWSPGGAWTAVGNQDYNQVVAIKVDNSWVWHCFMNVTTPKGSGKRGIVGEYRNKQWYISTSAKQIQPGVYQ